VPEALYDMDFPGHYYRRLKTVGVSVPSVVGPYTSISGTLTLLSSRVREKSLVSGSYADEANYRVAFLPLQSIATSTAQNDAGLFELNFRDERYLPFEGAGAISRWRFGLPNEFRAFDYETISDVILHLRYTARHGGEQLRQMATDTLADRLNALVQGQGPEGLSLLLSLRQDFQMEWRRFKAGQADLTLHVTDNLFPYIFRSRVQVQSGEILWSGQTDPVPMTSDDQDQPTFTVPLATGAELQNAAEPYLIVTYRV
jgi:hypothetical protein